MLHTCDVSCIAHVFCITHASRKTIVVRLAGYEVRGISRQIRSVIHLDSSNFTFHLVGSCKDED